MSDYQKISEMLERFHILLVSCATNDYVDQQEFLELREKLLAIPLLKESLPRFVLTCKDLKDFWAFISQQSTTYAGRREYLRTKFGPLIEEFEGISQAPSDDRVTKALTVLNSDTVRESWEKALQRKFGDTDGAITAARTLIENVCKHILEESGIKYQGKPDLPMLYRLTAETLELSPQGQIDTILRQVLGGCTSVVEGIGALRNAIGDAHGKGQKFIKPDNRHAELAVNLSGAMATFLVQTWEFKKK